MSKPTKSMLARLAIIGGVVTAAGGAGAVMFSANAQERLEPTPNEPLAYQVLKTDTAQSSAATSSASARPVATAVKTAATNVQPFRGDTLAGKPILLRRPMAPAKVDWQAALNRDGQMQKQSRLAGGLKSRLPRPELDKTRLPVILPREGGIVSTAKAKMISFGNAYALNMPQPHKQGVQVTVYGNRTFVPAEDGAVSKRPFARLAGVAEDIRIGQMEDGWTATFTRFGVVYSVDVSCDSMSNPDCKTDAFIRNVIAQMDDVTMGSEAQKEADAQVKEDGNWFNQITRTISNITRGG